MKKITLLCTVFCALQFNAFSQCPGTPTPGFTCVPNADFEQFLITFTSITGPLDGEISNAEAAAVTGTLNISNTAPFNAIDDFTGIEALTGITELGITYNTAVTSLDVSANTSLTILNTIGNTSLSTIVVGANPNLSEFRIPGCPVASMDLSANTGLTVVDVRQTALTSLDMRNGNNVNITSFDARFSPSLECIYVDDKDAGYLSGWLTGSSTFVNDEAGCNALSVESESQITFNMYPNPAKNTLQISTNLQESQIHIYDITGKLVLNKALHFKNNTVDVSAISSGVYLAKIVSSSKSVTKKLIIE